MKQRTRADFSTRPACTVPMWSAAQCHTAYGGTVAQDNGVAWLSDSPRHGQRAGRAHTRRSPLRDTRARGAAAGPWSMEAFGMAA
jgi:hypothetical protein